jgi:hypothetical protein
VHDVGTVIAMHTKTSRARCSFSLLKGAPDVHKQGTTDIMFYVAQVHEDLSWP